MAEPRWGRTFSLTLPSGVRVRAKRVSVTTILWSGGFPTELTDLVWKMFNEPIDPKALASDPAALRKMIGIIEQIVPHVLVAPRIGAETALTSDEQGFLHGTVNVGDIDDLDKQALMLFGQGLILSDEEKVDAKRTGATSGPRSFRDESAGADAGSAGETVQSAAVESGGPSA